MTLKEAFEFVSNRMQASVNVPEASQLYTEARSLATTQRHLLGDLLTVEELDELRLLDAAIRAQEVILAQVAAGQLPTVLANLFAQNLAAGIVYGRAQR